MPRAAQPLLLGLPELELLLLLVLVVELDMAEPRGHQEALLGAPRSA